jgi:hypothetical protein
MKQLVLHILFFFFSLHMAAQIVVERADYLLTDAGSSVKSWSLSTAGMAVPQEGADVTWDYSTQSLTDTFTFVKSPASGVSSLPEANLSETSTGRILGLVDVPVVFFERIDNNGFSTIGRMTTSFNLPLATITGGTNDTLGLIGGTNVYEESSYYVKFPLAYQDSWRPDFTIENNYLMTVAGFGLNKTPASQVTYFTNESSVVGYGTLILPDPDGSGNVSMEALLLRTDRVQVDSFFLAGQPAPQVMLGALGLVQGASSTRTTYSFYTKGLVRTALSLSVTNNQINAAGIADDIRNLTSSSSSTPLLAADFGIYPNPTDSEFQLSFEKTDASPWTLHVYNSMGQCVKTDIITGHNPRTEVSISLPETAAPGHYQVVLFNSKNEVHASGHIIKQ